MGRQVRKQQHVPKGKTLLKAAPRKQEAALMLFICFAVPFLLYFQTLGYEYVYDDISVIRENRFIRQGVEGIPSILTTTYRKGAGLEGDNLYRPLSLIMFTAEWSLMPGKPFIGHLMNILFYALDCLLLFLVLRKYLWKIKPLLILMVVLLFAAHPVHTEVVANIKSRDEIMAFFFLMLTMLVFHRWYSERRMWLQVAGFICFFLALLSKESAITMLPVIPLAGWYFLDLRRKSILPVTLGLIAATSLFLLIRHWVLEPDYGKYVVSQIDNVLTAAPDWITRVSTAILILGKYLWLLIFPHPLSCDYSYHQISLSSPGNPWFILSLLVYAALIAFLIVDVKKKGVISFGIFFYLITMGIASNLLLITGVAFAERLLFLPSAGFCMMLVFMLSRIFRVDESDDHENILSSARRMGTLPVILLLLFTAWSAKTVARSPAWRDHKTLMSTDIAHAPESARLNCQMGLVYRDQARATVDKPLKDSLVWRSLHWFNQALKIMPNYPEAQAQTGLAWYLLGYPATAEFYYNLSLRKSPMHYETWNNLGKVYSDRGDYDQALDVFSRSVALNPFYADGWQNKGSILGRQGKYEEAIGCFIKAIESDPEKPLSYKLLGLTYQNLGRQQESAWWFEQAKHVEMGLKPAPAEISQ